MGAMENEGRVDGFLMNPPRDSSSGDKRMARFHIAYHYYAKGGQKQFFFPVVCYGKTADWVLDAADLRPGDLINLRYKLKGATEKSADGKWTHYYCELIGNKITMVKKGKKHPEGGNEQFIGLPEGI